MITIFKSVKMRGIIIVVLCLLGHPDVSAGSMKENLTLLLSLKGNWSFSIGINDEWMSPEYDAGSWETIKVPAQWENQGYNGYNGYACYRKWIKILPEYKGRTLYLYMGYIDDVDEVYLNGHKIGSTGQFPPHFSTAYNAERIYFIPEQYINFEGSNLITVKVYDVQQGGGIVSGEIGLYGGKNAMKFSANLQNQWKFKTGDDMNRKNPGYDDSSWDNVLVPAKWEDQGYRNYDGYAWYRKAIVYQGNNDERMVLVLGKIDDVDQLYINGILISGTGSLTSKTNDWVKTGQEYQAFRGYYLPRGFLKKGEKYVIAIRVLDTGGEGGIYEGPVGLVTQEKYIEYWRKRK